MAKIAIIGAGGLGSALCKLLLVSSDHEILCIDIDPAVCMDLDEECRTLIRPRFQELMYPTPPVTISCDVTSDDMAAAVKRFAPDVIVCSNDDLKFISSLARTLGAHCVAFSDQRQDVQEIQQVEDLEKTFVLQTGLAPGLVNYFAMDILNDQLDTKMLTMACGSLPEVFIGDIAFTRSKDLRSTLSEYLQPALVLEDGIERYLDPATDLAKLRVSGVEYETFIVGGGVGDPFSYDVPNVCYRSIQFCGHLDAVQAAIDEADDPVAALSNMFRTVQDDYVILAVIAEDVFGEIKTGFMVFGPNPELGLNAQTIGAVCPAAGIIQLILEDQLPSGYLGPAEIPLDLLNQTAAMMIFERSLMYSAGR